MTDEAAAALGEIERKVSGLGAKVAAERAERGWSLAQLAQRAGLSTAAVHKIEKSGMTPTIASLMKIAAALGRSVSFFVDEPATPDVNVIRSGERAKVYTSKRGLDLRNLSGRYGPQRDERERRSTPEQRLRMGAERDLLMMMFHSERWVEECAKFVGPDEFEDPDYRRLFRVLIETEGQRDPEGRWLLNFPEDLAGDVEAIRQRVEHHDWSGEQRFFAENMDKILARPMEREARELKQDAPSDDTMDADVLARMRDQLALRRENRHLKIKYGMLDPDDPILRGQRRF